MLRRVDLIRCAVAVLFVGCTRGTSPEPSATSATPQPSVPSATYFDNTGRDDVLSGGVKMIPISTPKGTFNVWTKRVGNNPRIKVLLLHGGPGVTHEYLEAFDSYFPGRGHRVLLLRPARLVLQRPAGRCRSCGTCRASSRKSSRSGRRSVSTRTTSICFGQSWGGILGDGVRAEVPAAPQRARHLEHDGRASRQYNEYAEKVLMPAMDQKALAEIKQLEAAGKYEDPRYMELLIPNHYAQHLLRMPPDQWPDPVNRAFKHLEPEDLRADAGPERAGRERQAGELGSRRRI